MPANWERGQLTINDEDHWPGFYHRTQYWNGFRVPGFSKQTSKKILDWVIETNDIEYKWHFEEDEDRFVLEDEYGEIIYYEGFDIVYRGKKHHVYPIGSHEWIWTLYEAPAPRDPHRLRWSNEPL